MHAPHPNPPSTKVSPQDKLPQCDTVLLNCKIFTGLADAPVTGALAISDGRIITTDAAVAEKLAKHSRNVRDMHGSLIIPGFQDAHVHPISAGIELLSCNLTECETAEECYAAIKAYADSHPDAEWIVGAGWSMDMFPGGTPTSAQLDAIVPDRPVFLENRDHHGAWFNSAAAEIAGVTADTVDPLDGRLERDSAGNPTGTAHEGAMSLFEHVKPRPSEQLAYEGLLKAQEYLLSFGITAIQDAAVGEFLGSPDTYFVYQRAADEGTLRLRVRGAQWWERGEGSEQLQQILSRRDVISQKYAKEQFSVGSVKMMLDGVAENFTAAMHNCYLDSAGQATENRGITFISPEKLPGYVTELDAAGIQVHFHALGDRAVTVALNAIAAARETNGEAGAENRHHLAHLQVVAAEDSPRFKQLGAVANMQAFWACHEKQLDELTLPFLPAGAKERHYPFGELAAAGARLGAGSDWPVSTPNPLAAIQVAVTRVAAGAEDEPLGGKEQCLSLVTALKAYTAGSAYINHLDHVTGTLEEGKFADFAVLETDIFAVPAAEIGSVRVLETWISGEQVYAVLGE